MIGVNYVIVQSYPRIENANEARDFLTRNGIPCTVEKAPAGWPSTWFSVVSTRGFEHVHTPECETFKHQIEKLGRQFANRGQFKHFSPQLYAWR